MLAVEIHRGGVLCHQPLQAPCGECVGAFAAAAPVGVPCGDVPAVCLLEFRERAVRLEPELAVQVDEVGFVSQHARLPGLVRRGLHAQRTALRSVAQCMDRDKYNFWRSAVRKRLQAFGFFFVALSTPLAMAAGPSLGAHVFLGQGEGLGTNPAVTPAMDTAPSGSVLVAFNAGYASNQGAPEDTYRNRWKGLGGTEVYADYGDRFNVRAYVAVDARGGNGHALSIAKPGEPKGEISVPFIEVRGASRVQAFAHSYADPALVVASKSITVDGPATLLAFWWGGGGVKQMTATPGDGFTLIDSFLKLPDESGVQGAVAWRQVDAAGTYQVHWTAAPVQGAALWIMAIR